MRSLYLTLIYMAILALGIQSSFLFVMGYVWVDIFTPQLLAYSILPSVPVSMILGICVFISFFRLPRDVHVPVRDVTIMVGIFGIWMTMTLLWAAVPDAAYDKWNWAIKNILISCLIPFFLRGRHHIEAFLWTLVLSGIAHCLPFGAKVLLSGGGYGMPLGLINMNQGYGEGSTLAMFAISLIPMCMYLYKWQTLIPYPRLTRWMLIVFMVMALLTSVGTYARTGLVSIGVLGLLLILRSKNKVRYLVVLSVAALIVMSVSSDQWVGRMSTIGDGSEGSAMGRVAVWMWTLNYVSTHPFGGSFDVFRINEMTMTLADGSLLAVEAKAFHSIYFEILGETGIPGFLLFLAIVLRARSYFVKAKKAVLKPDDAWLNDAGMYLLFTLYVYLAGGAFIGVGFQSYFYYLAALSVALWNLKNRLQSV
jgi:probable O-glycosylation ligase (exosortase A-associated)